MKSRTSRNAELLSKLKENRPLISANSDSPINMQDSEINVVKTKSQNKNSSAEINQEPKKGNNLPINIKKQIDEKSWKKNQLLDTLAETILSDYPAIINNGTEWCTRGSFRLVTLSSHGTTVRIKGPAGVLTFEPNKASIKYIKWLSYFQSKKSQDPHTDAARFCCFDLKQHLENYTDYTKSDWVKMIDSDEWLQFQS